MMHPSGRAPLCFEEQRTKKARARSRPVCAVFTTIHSEDDQCSGTERRCGYCCGSEVSVGQERKRNLVGDKRLAM